MRDAPAASRRRFTLSAAGNLSLVVLATLAVLGALSIASAIVIPVVLAVFVNILLSPIAARLRALGLSSGLAALTLILTLVLSIGGIAGALADPAEQWLSAAPSALNQAQRDLERSSSRLSNLRELADEVDQIATIDANEDAQPVVVRAPGIVESFVGGLPSVAMFAGIFTCLTFLMLASGHQMPRRLARCGRSFGERRRVVRAARQIETELARYLGVITLINAALGLLTAAWTALLGLENPGLWGAMAGLFNFAPYVGPAISALALTLVGISSFDSLALAAAVPAGFVLLTVLEGQLVTPTVLGKRMALSPVFVFVAIVFWGWLWGPVGALMAVPLATALVVAAEHFEMSAPLARFVRGGRSQAGADRPEHLYQTGHSRRN